MNTIAIAPIVTTTNIAALSIPSDILFTKYQVSLWKLDCDIEANDNEDSDLDDLMFGDPQWNSDDGWGNKGLKATQSFQWLKDN